MQSMKEDVIEMRKMVENVKQEEQSLAMELLNDMKKANKRLFILLVIALLISLIEFGGFLYYITTYEVVETTETYETDMNTEDNGNIHIGGDVNNG